MESYLLQMRGLKLFRRDRIQPAESYLLQMRGLKPRIQLIL